MDSLDIAKDESGFRIDGFPDGVKIILLDSPKGKRLADLALHRSDLDFANNCLAEINKVVPSHWVRRQALWRSAIVHYFKCFGSDLRFQLNPKVIYKSEPEDAFIAFDYFRDLRNKHFVHDENSFAQSHPGAILNDGEKDYKIEKIITFSALSDTLEQSNYSNLTMLVDKALEWVNSQYDVLCDVLGTAPEILYWPDR